MGLVVTLVSGTVIAVLAAWLTNRSRNRQEQQAEIGALRVQADVMTVAVMELQGAAAIYDDFETLSTTWKTAHPQQLVDDVLRVIAADAGNPKDVASGLRVVVHR
jgi:type II secretory pathway pseudopilin PulG